MNTARLHAQGVPSGFATLRGPEPGSFPVSGEGRMESLRPCLEYVETGHCQHEETQEPCEEAMRKQFASMIALLRMLRR
jgi:hypothetical protein